MKTFLKIAAILAAGASIAADQTPTNMQASLTILEKGAEVAVSRDFSLAGGVVSFGKSGDRDYLTAGIQSSPYALASGVKARLGVGIGRTSSNVDSPDADAGGLWGSATKTEKVLAWSPYVGADISYELSKGVELFGQGKFFTSFAGKPDNENKFFSGVGLRVSY